MNSKMFFNEKKKEWKGNLSLQRETELQLKHSSLDISVLIKDTNNDHHGLWPLPLCSSLLHSRIFCDSLPIYLSKLG